MGKDVMGYHQRQKINRHKRWVKKQEMKRRQHELSEV